jgi:hypothetical protein
VDPPELPADQVLGEEGAQRFDFWQLRHVGQSAGPSSLVSGATP